MPADPALDLKRVEGDPRGGGQNLGQPTLLAFQMKACSFPLAVTRQGLVRPRHDLSGVSPGERFPGTT